MTGMFFYAYSLFAFVTEILEHSPSVFSIGTANFIYTPGTVAAFFGGSGFRDCPTDSGEKENDTHMGAVDTNTHVSPILWVIPRGEDR
ncbi:hypothetical protein HS1genome_1182 [Sulfodiicoccus acidiphilus]|uniref:Uncharacterized protein n=1 Tax=Sulfodiicoccus acidiphilus TaxID=1670455 RepID=A0A348B3P1_9CREN|nr:hypothetical protein HS1genome_1182 [Sulfodiicoccus acidiphilus]GGT99853.1 hypothetical protein GCM10007116_16550 [Sulfodiicoccus acidiphilus]